MNTVFVFNLESRAIKFISTGEFHRQHDPDFVDGSHFSAFNNNIVKRDPSKYPSEIILYSVEDRAKSIVYPTDKQNFYVPYQGKHQWLDNGNLLITESTSGRAIELDRLGKPVWEHINLVKEGVAGAIQEATRLGPQHSPASLQAAAVQCLSDS